jgi:iron complex transport system permease protein
MSLCRSKYAFLLSTALLGIAFFFAISLGTSGVSLWDLLQILLGSSNAETPDLARTILLNIRLPRVLVAALCGGAMAGAGVASQGLFRNALASPSVLGTESGGSLAAVLLFYLGPKVAHIYAMPLAAATGALLTTMIVLRMAKASRGAPLEVLLLTGLAISTLFSAVVSLVISLSLEDYQKAGAIMHWLLGGFSEKGWEHVVLSALPTIFGLALLLHLAPKLDVLSLGEDVARSLSLDVHKTRRLTIATVSILVGGALATAGALPFVGLVVPHLSRQMVGPSHRRLAIVATINGMTLTILADLLARTVRAPAEIEVGIVTALIGAPFFLHQLAKRSRQVSHV